MRFGCGFSIRTGISKRLVLPVFLLSLLFLISPEKTPARIIVLPIDDLSAEANHGKRQLMLSNTIALIGDLREKTGLLSIALNGQGELNYDRLEAPFSGSVKMRSLIVSAIDDTRNTFQIIDKSRSRNVHFSLTDQGTVDIQTGDVVYHVYFDFDDFAESRNYSSEQAIRSFSTGLVLFHEIDHKVSYDPTDPLPANGVRPDRSSRGIRGVIENTNIVRAELGLIPRDEKNVHRNRYRGLVHFLKKTAKIPFRNYSGKRKFLRWSFTQNR